MPHEALSVYMSIAIVFMVVLFVPWWIRDESARLFKAMVYLQNRLLSEKELEELYPLLCKRHGFKKI